MAKALQCPACGTKKRVDTLPDGESFRCERCGQVLKVPPGLGSTHRPSTGAPAPTPAAPRPVASGGDAPPVPRRRGRPAVPVGGAAAGGAAAGGAAAGGAAAGGVAVAGAGPVIAAPSAQGVPGAASPVVVAPPASGPQGRRSGREASSGRESRGRDALPLPLRVLAWLVALPLALAIVGIPARTAGYLTSQKLLDVIVKSDMTRFVPVLVIVLLWALVAAVLVTVFVEGGRRLMLRRRAKREALA